VEEDSSVGREKLDTQIKGVMGGECKHEGKGRSK